VIVWLDQHEARVRSRAGGKAATLAALAARGFPVPAGFVVPVDTEPGADQLAAALARLGGERFAVRSSAQAEDRTDASYAGLYESYLDVAPADVPDAIGRCRTAAGADRVTAYRDHATRPGGLAVLVQPMVPAESAGVAFTANPLTGTRGETVVTAVAGLGEPLVSGDAIGEEWIIRGGRATPTRPGGVLTADQALAVANLAGGVHACFGVAQDIEWAIAGGRVHLLQARPMTALPDPITWHPPGPGLWVRSFRLGEWLPDPVTPLFADWLLPRLEEGFTAGMRETAGAPVSFGSGIVHGWYYTRPNAPPAALPAAIWRSRGRLLPFMVNALIRPGRDPAAADRAVLDSLYHRWRDELLPAYRELADRSCADLNPAQLIGRVDEVGRIAGRHLWYLAVVGGAAWKMERCLARFLRRHRLDQIEPQALLRGLTDTDTTAPAHAVHSLDWFHPTIGEVPHRDTDVDPARRTELEYQRIEAETTCRDYLAAHPRALATFTPMLAAAQKYASIREQQARELTLGWPLLRACVLQLAQTLTHNGVLEEPSEIFFLTHAELGTAAPRISAIRARQETWNHQRRLSAPLAIGTPPPLIGRHLEHTLGLQRRVDPGALLIGQPASAGRATGPARLIDGPDDFDRVQPGDVLVARATTPAWTPLFGRVAAVVTDGGTLAAHASLIAREYGIPAVVGTQTATTRLRDGEVVTVDGTQGTVKPSAGLNHRHA
jgi:pyruvate,water dikinase